MKIRIAGIRENRKFVRIDQTLPVRFQLLDDAGQLLMEEVFEAETRDLCSSGACISLDTLDELAWKNLPEHSVLSLELALPAGEPLRVKGRVQWLRQARDPDRGRYLVGAEFVEMDEADRRRLIEFLKERFIDRARREDFPQYEAHTALEIENLTRKDWRGRIQLDSINLMVTQGKTVSIVGPVGSGKTLLMHILAAKVGFDEGRGRVFGFNLGSQVRVIRKIIGYMPQKEALYGNLTGLENLYFFARGLGVPETQLKPRAAEIISFCELSDVAAVQVRNLDMDQRRRLSLAVALAHNPKILLLDEPFTGADPKLRANFKTTFRRLTRAGVTILFTAHRLDNAAGCDRIAVMHRGRIIAYEDPKLLMARFPSKVTYFHNGVETTVGLRNPETELPALMNQLQTSGRWPLDRIRFEPPDPEDVWLDLVRHVDEEDLL